MNKVQLIKTAALILRRAINNEFRAQGHTLTGSWERSQVEHMFINKAGVKIEGFAAGYGGIVNAGVTAERIPFGNGTGKTSKYIAGLQRYFMLRKGLNAKEALGAAFATAYKHKQEGMPSLGSYRYSKTGQRLLFMQRANQKIDKELSRTVSLGMDQIFNQEFFKQKSERI